MRLRQIRNLRISISKVTAIWKLLKPIAFANAESLESFNFPKTVTKIGRNAFTGCTNMATATFADDADIQKIGEGAFADCGLQSISIPKKVQAIEREAFRNCI